MDEYYFPSEHDDTPTMTALYEIIGTLEKLYKEVMGTLAGLERAEDDYTDYLAHLKWLNQQLSINMKKFADEREKYIEEMGIMYQRKIDRHSDLQLKIKLGSEFLYACMYELKLISSIRSFKKEETTDAAEVDRTLGTIKGIEKIQWALSAEESEYEEWFHNNMSLCELKEEELEIGRLRLTTILDGITLSIENYKTMMADTSERTRRYLALMSVAIDEQEALEELIHVQQQLRQLRIAERRARFRRAWSVLGGTVKAVCSVLLKL